MRNPDEILAEAQERYNPNRGTNGMFTRQDIADFLAQQDAGTSEDEKKMAVELWLKTASWYPEEKRDKVLEDLASYL